MPKTISNQQFEHAVAQLTATLQGMGVSLDSDKSSDLDDLLSDFLDDKCGVNIIVGAKAEPVQVWGNDDIQFPRLIAEINAHFSLNGEELIDMLDSMGIHLSELDTLINRAEQTWEAYKELPKAQVNGKNHAFSFRGNPTADIITGSIVNDGTGLAIYVDGYFGNKEEDQVGIIGYLTTIDNDLHLAVYNKKAAEYPTHGIGFNKAKINSKNKVEEI